MTMFNSYVYNQSRKPIRLIHPSAKCVRCAKGIAIATPCVSMCLGFLLVIVMLASDDNMMSERARNNRLNRNKGRRPTAEPLEEFVERIGVCDSVPPDEMYVRNVTLRNNNTYTVNATVAEICKNITSMRLEYFQARDVKVNPFTHTAIIAAPNTCKEATDVIVLVHSYHLYVDRRKSIRESWGGAAVQNTWPGTKPMNSNIELLFVLGLHKNETLNKYIKQESDKYNDIIQGDFMDHYNNMTLKSLFGLKWVSDYCPGAKYLVKSDDDMIINFPHLVDILNHTNMTKGVMGPFNGASKVYRKGKWKLDKKVYPLNFYPPYESGSAYVISTDIVQPLFSLSEYVPHIFIDDVYITGILGRILHINHVYHKGFAFWTDKKPKVCDLVENKIVTGTKMEPQDMVKMWKSLMSLPYCKEDENT